MTVDRRNPSAKRSSARGVHGQLSLRILLAGLLGVCAALLVACGSSGKGLIPAANAGPLQSDFEAVAQAAESGEGNCTATEAAIEKTESDFAALPATVDAGLRKTLSVGIANLHHRALALCAQQFPRVTSTTKTSTPTTTTTTTSTPTTPTTSTHTETTTTPTTPTATNPTATTPGGGTPAPGNESAPGASSGPGGGTGIGGESGSGAGAEVPSAGGAQESGK
jgi:cytoskeletal protein RodZ